MICSSSIHNDQTTLILDTSVVINLCACSMGEFVLTLIPNKICVSDNVVAELNQDKCKCKAEHIFLQKQITQGRICQTALDEDAWLLLEKLTVSTSSIDDGEASTIAIAATNSFLPVIDDGKGRALAVEHMNKVPAWSLDLLFHPAVQGGLDDYQLADVVYMALSQGRMRIADAQCNTVLRLIGIERALRCTSLPGYKSKKALWQEQISVVKSSE